MFKANERYRFCCEIVTVFRIIFTKYKTFSMLIYSYINTSGNLQTLQTLTEEWREIFRVDIELYQHSS